MAATAPSPSLAQKNRSLPLLLAGFVLLAGANAGFWFYRVRGHAPDPPMKTAACKLSGDTSPLESVTLAPFLANLSGGEGYVKVTITLGVHKSRLGKGKSEDAGTPSDVLQSAVVRDTILGVLSTQTAAVLLTPEGKLAVKRTLKTDLDARIPGLALEDVYFTDFLVQQ